MKDFLKKVEELELPSIYDKDFYEKTKEMGFKILSIDRTYKSIEDIEKLRKEENDKKLYNKKR